MGAYRINFNYRPESVLGETRNGSKKIPCGTWKALVIGRRKVNKEAHSGQIPLMTKSILPNLSMVCLTAARTCLGSLTSALTPRQAFPVAADSSWAVLIRRSSLESCQNCCVPTNRKTLLSTDDGSTSTVSHLINGVNRESQSRRIHVIC